MLHAYTCPDQNSLLTLLTSAENPSLLYSTFSYFHILHKMFLLFCSFIFIPFLDYILISSLHPRPFSLFSSHCLFLSTLTITKLSTLLSRSYLFLLFHILSYLLHLTCTLIPCQHYIHSLPYFYLFLLSAQRTVASTVTQRDILCSKHFIYLYIYNFFFLDLD